MVPCSPAPRSSASGRPSQAREPCGTLIMATGCRFSLLLLFLFLAAGIHDVLPRFIRQLPGSLGDKVRFIQLLL